MFDQPLTEQLTGCTETGLRVYLLGPPGARWDDRALAIPRRQTRALLYRLATRLQPVPRERLAFLLWPDTGEATARRNLSRLLTHLRRALPDPGALHVADDCVGLVPHRVWSDTVAFERLRVTGQMDDLQRVVDLYRGPFLDGFSLPTSPEFETWAALERRRWERLYLETLAALVEGHAANKAYGAAIACARRYLATDDLAEGMYRRLIELYAATGDRHAALRQFERCVAVMERELGVSPLPETRAAYQAALEQRPLPPRRAASPIAWTTLPSLDAPLVGRDDALRQLERAYAHARSGRGRVVLISGEPGIGKSRLVQDFVGRLEGEATVLLGGGHEAERGLPYGPLVEALRSHLPTTDWTAPDVEPHYLAEVANLLPELRTLRPHLPSPTSVALRQGQGRLFEALVRWLLSLAAHRPPAILCLDDLHWADEATLSWLGYLARRLGRAPFLVLGAYRTGEVAVMATLRTELARLGILHELQLESLSPVEVLCLVRHLSGQTSGAERLSRRLHRETGGNPFFLLETLRAMLGTGILRQDESGWSTGVDGTPGGYRELPLPESVGQAIQARLDRLSPRTRQVLEAGAIIGHQFDFELVQATSGRGEAEVVDALDELLARQVISEHDGQYRFNHDLIQAAVYRDLSYGRRRLLHRRAGEALVEKHRPADAAALAWHFERAEEPGKAAKYVLRAGLAAKAVFAHAEARADFDRALALLEQEASRLREPEAIAVNQHRRVQALSERGWVLRLLGDMEAYARDSEEVGRLAGMLGDQHTLAHLRWREAYTHRWFCRYAQALEAAEEGLRLSRAATDRLLEALCWREVGMAARETGDYDRARAALERALSLFSDLGETVYVIHALGNLSTLHLRVGEYGRAADLAHRALARCEAARLPLERRLPLGDMGAVAVATGDVDAARRVLQESLDIARQIADRTQEILCLSHLGWLYVRLDQPAEALDHLQAGLALAESVGSCAEQSGLLSGLAEAHRLLGEREQAVACAHLALDMAQTLGRLYDEDRARRILERLAVL